MSGDETLLSDTLFSFIISAILAKDGKAHMIWLSAQNWVRIGKRLKNNNNTKKPECHPS